jgi:uncharacterized membrane protein
MTVVLLGICALFVASWMREVQARLARMETRVRAVERDQGGGRALVAGMGIGSGTGSDPVPAAAAAAAAVPVAAAVAVPVPAAAAAPVPAAAAAPVPAAAAAPVPAAAAAPVPAAVRHSHASRHAALPAHPEQAPAAGRRASRGAALPVDPPAPRADVLGDLERRAGTRWITWIGATALLIAAALFVKLAIDEGWLGPEGRVGLGAAFGALLIGAGWRAQRATMRPLAQALFGTGLGVLYLATYVAFESHGLIPRELAFGAMVSVTILGAVLALRYDAQAVAVFALLGGLVTPVAVSSGDNSRDALFTYLLVLDLGVLAIAMLRRWRGLGAIAFVGTYVLYLGWLAQHHAAAEWRIELAWLAAFHVVFLAVPFAFHLRRRLPLGPGRFWGAIAGAATTLGIAGLVLEGERHALGIVALVMAASYHAAGWLARRRIPGDGRAHFGFVALTVVLATLSIPLLLRDHGITLAWSLEAPVLLALGYHHRYFPIRLAGLGVLALAGGHLVTEHLGHAGAFTPFANAGFLSALAVPAAAALFAVVHHSLRHRGDTRDRWLGIAAALGGVALALVVVHVEIAEWLSLAGRHADARALVPLVWASGSILTLAATANRRDLVGLAAAAALAAAAGALVVLAYDSPADPGMLALNGRFAAAIATVVASGALAGVVGRRGLAPHARTTWAITLGGLGALVGAEAYLHYAAVDAAAYDAGDAGRRAHTALSIAWAGYAAALLGAGFARRKSALRIAGLVLLGGVAAKVVVVDLAGAPQLLRVVSFLTIGALMIGASYAYHRLERR